MTKLKCPVCQNNLHKINIVVSTCTNDKCKLWGAPIPNLVLEALTQTEQNLERTRKALDVAVDALNRILNHATAIDTARCRAEMALDQITALE